MGSAVLILAIVGEYGYSGFARYFLCRFTEDSFGDTIPETDIQMFVRADQAYTGIMA